MMIIEMEINLKQFARTILNMAKTLTVSVICCIPLMANAASDGAPNRSMPVLGAVLVVAWIAIVTIGGIAGWRQSITVFRNYDDLALVFFAGCDVQIAFLLVLGFHETTWLVILVLVIAAAIFLWLSISIIGRTWADNSSILWFFIALATKITFAALFLSNLIELINPSGKTQLQRSQNRGGALFFLLIITPIVHRLVRDKEGVWAPKDVLSKYHRGRLKL
jgi:hypothetical protein